MNDRELTILADLIRVIDKKPAVAPEIINDYLSKHKFIKGPEKAEFLNLEGDNLKIKDKYLYVQNDIILAFLKN